ncbi:PREDICTED: nuclear pore glycoprotein p62 [Ceratosolen solmsi marchali]|uniref:Nuclear pore glycoprotein p62 n=1 Tax=Ceratosolen solmsi marchali TaxID=326594 RepID=A0AAJ7DVV5_9HYME|nr:PREDICTED: nuclear pore glycoprotein p62 [Ceratosolen solmsi marchali]
MNFPAKTQSNTTPGATINFGVPAPSFNLASNAPATTSAAGTSLSLGGGFGIGASTATTTSITTMGTGFNLGATATTASGFSLSNTAAATTPTFNLSSSTTTTSSGFNLGGSSSSTPSTGYSLGYVASTTVPTGLTLTKTTSLPASTTIAAASQPQTSLGSVTTVTTSSASRPPGAINFCQLEESINKWTLELEEQEKVFVNQATQINAWDRLLIGNGEKIVILNQEVERVKLEQQQLEHELDYVVGQQKELQDCLVPLEKELALLSVTDPEREYTYRLAENIDTQLKQMSEDLKEIIEHLNEANRSQDSSDPIVQIVKILNAHMNSLQWLVQQTNLLNQKIQQINQMHQSFRQENERSFNLAYN